MSDKSVLPQISYTKPSVTILEQKYVSDAALNGWGDQCYDYINRFESEFAEYLGSAHAIATSSCTGALHMGLSALGIGSGDEVILADTNWIATVAPIVHLGATPVFVDIDPISWCIDPNQVQRAITNKTKAVIATHLYGQLCDMDRLSQICAENGIYLIEDAAEAIGASYKRKKAGSIGVFGVFSFHGTKTITTGEGGMFVTNDNCLYEHVMTLSNHGRNRNQVKQFWPDVVGFKYKISNIQAALGCAQLKRISELCERKKQILENYRNQLAEIDTITMNANQGECEIGAWMPTVVFTSESGITRQIMMSAFAKQNIDARVFFHPLSGLEMFKPVVTNTFAWDIPERAINLPSYHDMSDAEIGRVCDVIRKL